MDERVDRTEADVEPAPLSRETRVTRPSRLRQLVIPVILITIGLGVGWFWWTHRAPQPASRSATAQAAPQPVGAATIDKGDIRIVLNELGTVTPLATVTVKTQINGQLVDVGFKEGQVVKKGDFLAQIDPRPFQVTLEQAQGQLAHDQGLLQQAQTNLKRFQTLGRQDSIAQQQVDDQRYLVAQDIGTVQSDQAQVDSANLNLTYCHIVSPITGQIGLRQVDAGNYVQTSDANGVVVITQMQPISVIFSVPEDNLPDIIQRLHTGATLSVEAYDRANVRKLATGQLGTLDNQIDTTTGTLKLRAMFDNPDELLYPNQFVNARLLVNTMQNTVRVPVPAVQRGEPGTFVYVINANNTVSVRPVKLGPTDGGYAAVLSGLQPGDRVVTDGTDRLRDGAAVTVPAPGQTPGRGQGGAGQAASPGQTAQPGQPAQPGQTPPEPGQRPDGQRGQRHSTQPQ
jgi:membrane fusion protein, multidrug efflux system